MVDMNDLSCLDDWVYKKMIGYTNYFMNSIP